MEEGEALKEAFEKAVSKATGFAKDHPVLLRFGCTGGVGYSCTLGARGSGDAELGLVEG